MKKIAYSVAGLCMGLFLTACGGGSSESIPIPLTSGSSTPSSQNDTNITAVDGYIKDATIKDASGIVATYDANGTYRFSSSPMYPITLSGGVVEDTNVSFDINMSVSDGTSLVISPITTFLGNDSTLLTRFANLGLTQSTLDEFSVDYVDTNETNLAKLSQLLYAMLKDANLTATFKQDLENNSTVDSLDKLFDLAKSSLDTASINSTLRGNLKAMIQTTKDINASAFSARGVESYIKAYKIIAKNHYKDSSFISTLQTGQTTSYHANDDANLSRGLARSYSRNDTKEVVVDNVTQLMWQDNTDANTTTKKWADAVAYCENLTLGGYSDWRLPSVEELISITDIGRYKPAIDPAFKNVVSDVYWSSSTGVYNTSYVWYVGFRVGSCDSHNKSRSYYVRCVRDNN